MIRLVICLILLIALCASCAAAPQIVLRNNYDFPYSGPVTFKTNLPDGGYVSKNGSGNVKSGVARMSVKIPAHSGIRLTYSKEARPTLPSYQLDPLLFSFGLVAIPGRTGDADTAVSSFQPLSLNPKPTSDGTFTDIVKSGDYEIAVTVFPTPEGFIDVDATVTNKTGNKDSVYLALVRRTTTAPQTSDFKMRWNGRYVDGDVEPVDYQGSWGNNHCVDWFSWKSTDLSYCAVSGFTPGLTVETSPGRWQNANHTYVWEHVRRQGDKLYFISEIAGPDPSQKPGYTGIRAYMPPLKDEPVKLRYRLAIAKDPEPTWQESQFLVFAGYRSVTRAGDEVTVNLGVPAVEFGTSYFPYSTMCENFDYYRTPSLDREGWWPFAPAMWEKWREFAPQMRTDLRIIRAMGFGWVRLHHLELIGKMDRKNAMAFLDFYMRECRKLGLKVMIDTSGTPEWFATLAGRYKDVVKRIEVENEVLIPGIKPGDPERWTACYNAAKKAAPATDVFLTGSCNVGIFDRLDQLGVPYDRVGYHSYKHREGAEETLSSLAVGMAGVAAERGKTPVLAEFNWKFLTRHSPELRAKEYAAIFGKILEPRQVPELLQFHWQETLSVNPRLTRGGLRHYETIYLDRRPKPEAFELMKLIKRYSASTAPVRQLPIQVTNAVFTKGKAVARFTITNTTTKPLTVKLTAESFGDAVSRVTSPATVLIKPGKSAAGTISVSLKPNALSGVYHFFVRADYAGKTSYGWGYASNYGIPALDSEPVLPELVDYPTGARFMDRIDWTTPICVAFGPDSPIIELEMAYIIANTLQAATGRSIRLCSTADIPVMTLKTGTLILVGTPESNPLIAAQSSSLLLTEGKGAVEFLVHKDANPAPRCLIVTGSKPEEVQSAATDFVLRYWSKAKDAVARITGLEKGAALGSKAAPGLVNPP